MDHTGDMMITIREASAEDMEKIHEIELLSFTVPWSKESFLSALSSEMITIFAAEREGILLGFGCVSVLPPEGEILNIAVSPEARGSGMGRKLLTTMLNHARERGAHTAFLEVRESNTPARTLYESAGFLPLGIRKNYYDKPRENAVIMQKSPL